MLPQNLNNARLILKIADLKWPPTNCRLMAARKIVITDGL
jgi:hypothetical protein